jgi:glycosyltransferase involved in cell wall biosynthesis
MKTDFEHFNIKIIGNHVAADLFQPAPKEIHPITAFLHVSTMDERTKNPEGILDACVLLKNQESKFLLTIISDEDVSKWKILATNKGLSENIKFIGPLEWSELVPYYQKADALVVFSHYESFSIVIAEAWMTGTPVISTSVGIAHNMDASMGILVEKNVPKSLSQAMLSVINKERSFDQNEIIRHAAQFKGDALLEKWSETIEQHVE